MVAGDVFDALVRLTLPIAIATVPSCIAVRCCFYLTQHYWGSDAAATRVRFEIVVSAFTGAITCLVMLGIFLMAEYLIPSHSRFDQDQYRLVDRTIVVMFAVWMLIGLHFVIKNVIESTTLRNVIEVYLVLYVILKYAPGKDYALIKVLSYGYSELSEILVRGAMMQRISKEFSAWPETILDFSFYFAIAFALLRYTANIVIHIQARNSRDSDSPFDMEAIVTAVDASIWIAAFIIALGMLRIDLGGFGWTTGLVAAGLTISFRDLLNNFLSGILLNLDKSIKKRDVIRMVDGVVGEVKKISLRYTLLETRDNVEILVPNSVLVQNRFENFTRTQQEVRLTLRFSVGQNADVAIVEKLAAKACMYVPEVAAVTARLPMVFYVGVSDSAHLFDLKFWVSDPRPGLPKLQSDVAKQLFKVFKEGRVALPRIRHMIINDPSRELEWPVVQTPTLPRASKQRARGAGRSDRRKPPH